MSDRKWDFDCDEGGAGVQSSSSHLPEYLKPTQLLIAIDTHESMFNDGSSAFRSCLHALLTVLDELVLKADKKQLAVIVTDNLESRATLMCFNMPIIEKIAFVKNLLNMSEQQIKTEYMRTGSFDFASFLLFVKKQFSRTSSDTHILSFLFITNDSNPVCSDSNIKFRALTEAHNIPNLNIGFELITMSPQFSWDLFYEDFYKAMRTDLVKELCEDEEGLVLKILPMLEPSVRYRTVRFYPSINTQKLFMKVYVDPIVHRPKVVLNKEITRDSHQEVRKKPNLDRPFTRNRVVTVRKDLKLILTGDEVETLQLSSCAVGYTLLGVVNQTLSRPEIVLKKHDLMMENPKEKDCNYFQTFWKYCVERKKVLFCSYRHSRITQVSFCELIPTIVNKKCCFLIKYLYFLNDYLADPAELPFDEDQETSLTGTISNATIANITKVVDALTFSYNPLAFYDVQSAREEAYVKSQVLGEPMEDIDVINKTDKIDQMLDGLGVVQKRGGGPKSGAGRQKK